MNIENAIRNTKLLFFYLKMNCQQRASSNHEEPKLKDAQENISGNSSSSSKNHVASEQRRSKRVYIISIF